MGVPYESDSQGELPYTPPPTYAAVIGGESVEMVETKGEDIKKKEGVSKMDKGKKEDEKEKEAEEGPPVPPPVGLIELFKFSTPLDAFLVIFGLTVAFGCGSSMPLLCITFGDTLQSFSTNANHKATEASANGDWEAPPSDVLEVLQWSVLIKMKHLNGSIQRFGIYMFILSAVLWILSWIFVTCLNLAAARQVFRIRGEFLRAVLRQDIAWYDTNTSTDFASRLTE